MKCIEEVGKTNNSRETLLSSASPQSKRNSDVIGKKCPHIIRYRTFFFFFLYHRALTIIIIIILSLCRAFDLNSYESVDTAKVFMITYVLYSIMRMTGRTRHSALDAHHNYRTFHTDVCLINIHYSRPVSSTNRFLPSICRRR